MATEYLISRQGPPLLYRSWIPDASAKTPQSKKAVFLGHSQPTHSGMLAPLAKSFCDRGWKTFAGDIRGHGGSTNDNHPIGHLAIEDGWAQAVDDLRLFLTRSFEDVAWENRLVVVPNITALMTLEVLKDTPDLAQHIVLIAPPPNQVALSMFGKTFSKIRSKMRGADQPDEQILHHLYAFLGSHLKDRKHPADVMTTDRAIIEEVLADPMGWPTPTPGYWYNIFCGMASAWNWPDGVEVAKGTRCLVLFGGEDAMMRDGGFLPPIKRFLHSAGITDIDAARIDGGRSALFLEEERLRISDQILSWINKKWQPEADVDEISIADVAARVLAQGEAIDTLDQDELLELCYNAVEDESRWTEIILRLMEQTDRDGDIDEGALNERLRWLMPHWQRSFELNKQVMINATLGVLLQEVVERLHIGLAILNSDAELLHFNSVFAETLHRLMPRGGGEECPPDDNTTIKRSTDTLLAETGSAARLIASGESGVMCWQDAPVGFLFTPAALRRTRQDRKGPAAVLILRAPGDANPEDDTRLSLIELAYGLTAQEAKVALQIAKGNVPKLAAEELDISVATVRTHMKSVFSKTGVHSQAELTARILSGPMGWLE